MGGVACHWDSMCQTRLAWNAIPGALGAQAGAVARLVFLQARCVAQRSLVFGLRRPHTRADML